MPSESGSLNLNLGLSLNLQLTGHQGFSDQIDQREEAQAGNGNHYLLGVGLGVSGCLG